MLLRNKKEAQKLGQGTENLAKHIWKRKKMLKCALEDDNSRNK